MYLTVISGFLRALWCKRGKHVRIPFAASRDQIHHWLRLFAVTLSSPESSCVLFRHHFRTIGRSEMAIVKQTQKMIPLVTCEISLG